jgi:hypothetical protein
MPLVTPGAARLPIVSLASLMPIVPSREQGDQGDQDDPCHAYEQPKLFVVIHSRP